MSVNARGFSSASRAGKAARADLAKFLRTRRVEVEQATLSRVHAIADPAETADPEYIDGLRAAVSAALEYGIATIELGDDHAPPVPAVLLSQARLAVRLGVSLDTVLRRYFAGFVVLSDFVIGETEMDERADAVAMHGLLRARAAHFDRLIAVVSEAYADETKARLGSVERRRVERVRKLLDGELLDAPELAYEFDGRHLGAIATGAGAPEALAGFARELDYRLLLVRPGRGTVWAWFGHLGRGDRAEHDCERLMAMKWPAGIWIAFGEPGEGIAGWKRTHRQAKAALPIAMHGGESRVRYRDVALLAATFQDDLLAGSLRQFFLAPLADDRDGGGTLRETLRAYFATEFNVSSAAASLGVSRHTVASRLRTIERRLGRPVAECAGEIALALRLEDLDSARMPVEQGP